MAKIRHLAIKTKSPEKLATFYEEVFGMKRIRSEKGGAIYMSDGYLTLALLRNRGEATPSGINHFGFQTDDLKDIEEKLLDSQVESISDDEIYEDAKEAVIDAGVASTSYLQRSLGIGYARAARLMDQLEESGVIGKAHGANPRKVLIAIDS